MSEMSAAEAAVVARFDAAEPAPESWRGDAGLRKAIRKLLFWGVDTGKAADATDALLALPEVAALRAKAAAADRVRELADTYAFLGATLHDVPRAETWTEAATELRAALDGPPC